MKRRLSTILAADVVGFSRMMEADEERTILKLGQCRKTIDSLITQHHGRIFGSAGDSVLAEYQSPVEAIRCAAEIQSAISFLNNNAEDTEPMRFRIGINLGDVIVDGDNLLGDGVNVAARLESIADPGGITLASSVYEQVRKAVDLKFEDLGGQQVKNIDQPVHVYRVALGEKQKPEPSTTQPSRLPSIAVMPFGNLSGDADQEYFSDGITEDIITALSHFKAFPVIARNSTFTYKGQSIRVEQIAKELGARYVIEGSVRKAGERVRISVQLIDAETGNNIWAEKYDFTMVDIFDIQDEITLKVVSTIQPELTQSELAKSSSKRPENLTAWDKVLQAMALINKNSSEDHVEARKLLQSALDIDPNYQEAWSTLAWSYVSNLIIMDPNDRDEFIEKGLHAANKAVELDSGSAQAHYVLGVAYVWSEQFDRSIAEAETALRLNPYHAQTHMGLGNRLDLAGRVDEGIEKMKMGLQLSPKDPFRSFIMACLSRAYLTLDQPEVALGWIEQCLSVQPKSPDLRYRHAICLAHMDRIDEAKAVLNKCEELQPGFVAMRKKWKPYSDDERNKLFFLGVVRHNLFNDWQ